jgi:hypothetical protein
MLFGESPRRKECKNELPEIAAADDWSGSSYVALGWVRRSCSHAHASPADTYACAADTHTSSTLIHTNPTDSHTSPADTHASPINGHTYARATDTYTHAVARFVKCGAYSGGPSLWFRSDAPC